MAEKRQPVGPGFEAMVEAAVTPFTLGQRETMSDQAILMLEELYAHLPLKRALHATNPIQRLGCYNFVTRRSTSASSSRR